MRSGPSCLLSQRWRHVCQEPEPIYLDASVPASWHPVLEQLADLRREINARGTYYAQQLGVPVEED